MAGYPPTMKAANSGLRANGCYRRNNGRNFRQLSYPELPGYQSEMTEDHVSSMMLGQSPGSDVEACEPQVLAAQAGKIQLTALSRGHYPGAILLDNTLPGLGSIGFWDGAAPQDWGVAAQRNKGLEIHFVETGNMAFSVEDQQFDLGAGDLTVTRPWQLHQLGDPHIGPGRVHWLSIDVGVRNPNDQWRWPDWVTLTSADKAELTHKLRRNKMPVCKSTPEIARLFQQITNCIVQWNTPHSISRMTACLNQLFVCLLDVPATQNSNARPVANSNRKVIEDFLKGLEDSPANCEEISSLQQMAEQCGMGVTALTKHTRDFANIGPMEFLKRCRLNHAARQLCERRDVSITDVCFSNGFNSSQYFATCFRKQFKMSPSEFVSKRC